MADRATLDALDALIQRLAAADWKGRDAVKAEILTVAMADTDRAGVKDHLQECKRNLELEVRWEVDEVLEDLTPPPEPEPEEEPPPEDPNRPLRASDLDLVYDDPRGIRLHKAKTADRWFLTQADPYTGQPRMMELNPAEVTQVKQQLDGSPYWVLGAGGAS